MAHSNLGYYIDNSTIGGQSAGKGFFSDRDVKNGEAIVTIDRPLMGSLEAERQKDTCANCFVWTEGSLGSSLYVKPGTTVQTCAGCKHFRYCSKSCQRKAWNRGHKHECKNLRQVADRQVPKAVLGCMDILVRRKHGLIEDSTWKLLCHLNSHLQDFKEEGRFHGIELMAAGASQFSGIEDTFSNDFVADMYSRVLSNSMTLVAPTFDPLGIVIEPLLCHLNHSCDPNAFIVMDGPQMQLRALKDIAKDEELFISYIDPTMPLWRRQSELQQRWFFECGCSKCRLGSTGHEDKWVLEAENLSAEYKRLADQELEQYELAEDSARDIAGLADEPQQRAAAIHERRVLAIQRKAFQMYDEEQQQSDPAEVIRIIDEAIELCTNSGLWSVHRQPLPALRDDLIANLLTVGNYERAWFECTKRHSQVTPTLYPQMHHPIRVIHTCQMAMLAQYLASTGAVIAPEADMALIAAMLINTVSVMSKLSHGEESAFSKSLQNKYLEVVSELGRAFGSDEAMDAAIQRQVRVLAYMGK